MPTNHEQHSDDVSRLADLEPAPAAQNEAVKGGSDVSPLAFQSTAWCTACAESKGQVQGELARFR